MVILTRLPAVQFLDRLTVAPITNRVRPTPSFVPLTLEDGLFGDCAVNCDSLMTTAKDYMGKFIATLSAKKMAEVEAAIRFALGLNAPPDD